MQLEVHESLERTAAAAAAAQHSHKPRKNINEDFCFGCLNGWFHKFFFSQMEIIISIKLSLMVHSFIKPWLFSNNDVNSHNRKIRRTLSWLAMHNITNWTAQRKHTRMRLIGLCPNGNKIKTIAAFDMCYLVCFLVGCIFFLFLDVFLFRCIFCEIILVYGRLTTKFDMCL